ncbi:hypothetical protein [Thermoactinospora rubra]|uniref:hypothetical protein n=1 Tax=Thermoactinospora rubra TaxID=1088767 RepID=UPI0011805432|nr:hypothetical protein [Thermoactinospora rubra]
MTAITPRDPGPWFAYAPLPENRWERALVVARARLGNVWRRIFPEPDVPEMRWHLHAENGGWALRRWLTYPRPDLSTPPEFFTTAVPVGDKEAAFGWARSVLPDHPNRVISWRVDDPSAEA